MAHGHVLREPTSDLDPVAVEPLRMALADLDVAVVRDEHLPASAQTWPDLFSECIDVLRIDEDRTSRAEHGEVIVAERRKIVAVSDNTPRVAAHVVMERQRRRRDERHVSQSLQALAREELRPRGIRAPAFN